MATRTEYRIIVRTPAGKEHVGGKTLTSDPKTAKENWAWHSSERYEEDEFVRLESRTVTVETSSTPWQEVEEETND